MNRDKLNGVAKSFDVAKWGMGLVIVTVSSGAIALYQLAEVRTEVNASKVRLIPTSGQDADNWRQWRRDVDQDRATMKADLGTIKEGVGEIKRKLERQ